MSKDRRESNKKYYEKHKKRWKKYKRKARIKAKQKAFGSYKVLSDKQKKFKRAVDQGIDPAEAVKRAYPDTTNISRKLTEFKHNPVLATSIDRYVATMEKAGFTDKYEAESQFNFTQRARKKGSTPHDVRNAIIVFQDYRKTRGLDVERSETRSLNINITVTPEQAKHMARVPEEEDVIDV